MRLHAFRPRLVDALAGYDRRRFAADLGAGLTVGIVALPLAMAFGIASGVKPEQGIFTAIIAGFLISALGGSQVQIGGPAGAFIVVVYGIVQRYGLANLLVATVLAGLLMFAMGLLRLGVLVRYIPVAIVIGFTNGIAVLIALSQLKDLLGLPIARAPAEFFALLRALAVHLGGFNPHALALGLACLGGLLLWPRLFRPGRLLPGALFDPERRRGRVLAAASRLPGPIVALLTLSALARALELPVETIGSRFGGIPTALPAFAWPAIGWDSAQQLLIPTVTIALLGAVESLLCARVADNLAGAGAGPGSFPRHDANQELMAQGVANVVVPFFGGIPATGTIARTMTNLRAGATSPVAGIVHALALLAIVLAAGPLAMHVPLAVLAGILLFVAWNMGEWHEFAQLRRHDLPYATLLVGTFVLTVVFDLTVAMQAGLLLACVFFIYRMGTLFRIDAVTLPPAASGERGGAPEAAAGSARAAGGTGAAAAPPGDAAGPAAAVQAMRLHGALFFGAVGAVEAVAERLAPGTRGLALDFERLIFIDSSGLDALQQLARALRARGVRLVVCGAADQPGERLRRSGLAEALGADNVAPDLDSALARLRGEPRAPPAG